MKILATRKTCSVTMLTFYLRGVLQFLLPSWLRAHSISYLIETSSAIPALNHGDGKLNDNKTANELMDSVENCLKSLLAPLISRFEGNFHCGSGSDIEGVIFFVS